MTETTPTVRETAKEEIKYLATYAQGGEAQERLYSILENLITQAHQEGYERGVKETSLKHSEKIRQLLTQYANTPLKERKTGWDWLLKARNVVEEEYRTITNLPTN